MSNDSSPVGGAHGFDSDALEEWVAETARQKGVSKQKLLDEILSSYWVLEELSGVVTDSSVRTVAASLSPALSDVVRGTLAGAFEAFWAPMGVSNRYPTNLSLGTPK